MEPWRSITLSHFGAANRPRDEIEQQSWLSRANQPLGRAGPRSQASSLVLDDESPRDDFESGYEPKRLPNVSLGPASNLHIGMADIAAYPCTLRDGRRVVLVDTPGFGDTERSDTEIITEISGYLAGAYEAGVVLTGVVYLHLIDQRSRMSGAARENLDTLLAMCGGDALSNVALATTMWTERILRFLLEHEKIPLWIQQEIVKEDRNLDQTTVGQTTKDRLNRQEKRIRENIQRIERQLQRNPSSWALKNSMRQYNAEIGRIRDDRNVLEEYGKMKEEIKRMQENERRLREEFERKLQEERKKVLEAQEEYKRARGHERKSQDANERRLREARGKVLEVQEENKKRLQGERGIMLEKPREEGKRKLQEAMKEMLQIQEENASKPGDEMKKMQEESERNLKEEIRKALEKLQGGGGGGV
ncbi:hypothetical protein DL768_010739 [Monosporascus sp. mg162]|nr:hypothetical protein DL768_010739 [Monosporascus sp. mg162]